MCVCFECLGASTHSIHWLSAVMHDIIDEQCCYLLRRTYASIRNLLCQNWHLLRAQKNELKFNVFRWSIIFSVDGMFGHFAETLEANPIQSHGSDWTVCQCKRVYENGFFFGCRLGRTFIRIDYDWLALKNSTLSSSSSWTSNIDNARER